MKPRVLVIVPSFPSLSQPWVDTYLESLLREGLQFTVLTSVKTPTRFHSKVMRLGLLERTRQYLTDPHRWLPELVKAFVSRPIRTSRSLRFAWSQHEVRNLSLMRRIKSTLSATYLATVIANVDPFDIVHVHFEGTALAFLAAVRETGRPMVMTFHGLPPKDVAQPNAEQKRILFSQLAGVFVNTECAKAFVKDSGCPESIIRVVPQGLPLEDFPFRRVVPPTGDQPLILLSVGRFHRDKGHAHAILAASRLARRGIRLRWRLVGVGPDVEIQRLRRLIAGLHLDDCVEMACGVELEQLRGWYRESHIFVLASIDQGPGHLIETQGVVVQEAQAVGCIPIVTNTGGIPECVTNGVDALIVRPGSSRAIHDAVVWLMDNQDTWAALTESGRRNVEQRFSAVGLGRQMVQHLNEFCASENQTSLISK